MGGAAMMVREIPDEPYRVGQSGDEVSAAGEASHPAADSEPTGAPAAASPPNTPAPDIDAIEALGEEYVLLDAKADALTQRSLAVLAEFDRLRGWELAGYPSCAHWIAARRKVELHTARERVRAAKALAELPRTRAAMAQGRLSFCQVRALTRAATPANEDELLTLALDSSVHELERTIRAWKRGTRQSEAERERERYESRTLSIFPDDEGGYELRARLTPEAGALLRRALEAANDALFRERGSSARTDAEKHREAGRRRADALELLAERALAAGFGPPVDDQDVPVSGNRAERYQVVLHVEPQTLTSEAVSQGPRPDGERPEAPLALSEIEDGTRVSHETARRLTCDATVVEVAQSADGTVLDVGRKSRTIPWRLRRALEIRDRGCRFPGCGRRFTDGHHVTHWADGGATSLENLTLLCKFHHTLVHEGRWRIGFGAERRPIFFDPRGHLHYDGRWQPPVIPADALDDPIAEEAAIDTR
jgi:hypothetical protein